MADSYMGISGCVYLVGNKLGGGGEGSIHIIENSDSQVAKIFKPERRSKEREEKLCCMARKQPDPESLENITWPQDVIYDQSGFVGYVMPKIENADSITVIYGGGTEKRYELWHRLFAAVNLCHAVKTVHDMGQVCGDLNPQNICIQSDLNREKPLHITLVDTDSYHFSSESTIYRCEVGLADYIAPEVQRKMTNGNDLKSASLPTYTKETDLFALAVHIFALLMNGCHPFACAKETNGSFENTMSPMDEFYCEDSVAAPQPIENIKNGFFPFYEKRQGITYPLYAPSFDSLPEKVQGLFVRTFVEGYTDPERRVDAQEWIDALTPLLHNEIVPCLQNKAHSYFRHNSSCPMCRAEERMRKGIGINIDSSESTESGGEGSGSGSIGGAHSEKKMGWCILLLSIFLILCLAISLDCCGYVPKGNQYDWENETQWEWDEGTDESANSEETVGVLSEKEADQKKDELKKEKERKKKVQRACLNYGKRIQKQINRKHYRAALKLIKRGYKKKYLKNKNKIFIKNGKLCSKINRGKGFVYSIRDDYAYIGFFKNGKADGRGIEVGNPVETAYGGYYTIQGLFRKGYPNGKCTVYYSKYEKDSSATFSGTYKRGWENGSFVWTDRNFKGGHSDTYYFSSVMGKRQVIEMYKGNYVYAKAKSGWFYYSYAKSGLRGNTTEHHGKKH